MPFGQPWIPLEKLSNSASAQALYHLQKHLPGFCNLSGMLTISTWTPRVVLQVPDALTQSFRLKCLVILSHTSSGSCRGCFCECILDISQSTEKRLRFGVRLGELGFLLFIFAVISLKPLR